MGCGGSKEDDDGKSIPYRMNWTYVPSADEIFENIENILSDLEDIRSGLEDTKEEMLDIADCDKIEGGDITDAIQGFFWALSANNDGKIETADLWLRESEPYFHIVRAWEYPHQVDSFITNFEEYVKTVFQAPDKIINILKNLGDLLINVTDLKDTIVDDAKNAGIGLRALQAPIRVGQNILTLKTAIERGQRIKGVAEEAVQDLKKIIPNIPKWLSEANEYGKKAIKDKLKKPDDCLLTYTTKKIIDEKAKKEIEKQKQKRRDHKNKKKEAKAKHKAGKKK